MSLPWTEGRAGAARTERHAPGGTLAALVRHTLGLQRRSTLIWGVVLGLYTAAIVATFPSFAEMGQIDELLRAYPEGLRKAFGIEDLGTVEGFLATQVFSFMAPLALAFFPILAAAGAIAGAEERGTLDVLLGNPLPRWQVVVGILLSTVASLAVILAIATLLTWGTALPMGVALSLGAAAAGFGNLWPFCMVFGALAMVCSALLYRRALAIALPGAVLVAMYLLDVLGKVSADLEGLRRASVFSYYGSAIEDGMDGAGVAGLTALAAALGGLAVLAFQRRDIYT